MKKFSYRKVFLLGFGFFGVSVIWSVYNAFVPIFLSDKFGVAPFWIGFFMTLDNIAALFIQPPVGAWSDKLRTRFGRRIPFLMIGAPISAVAFGFIPVAAVLPLFVACTSTLLFSMAFWRTPVIALMADITPSPKRSQANGIINFMGGIGAIIAFLYGGKLFEQNTSLPFWVGSVLVVLSAFLVFLFIKEPKEYEEPEKKFTMFLSLREIWNDPDKSALRLFLAILAWFIGYNAIEAFFTLYAVNYLGISAGAGAGILGHLSLFFVLFALVAGFIGGKIGRRVTISMGLISLAILLAVIFLLAPEVLANPLAEVPVLGTVRVISLLMMGVGVAWSLINVNSLPMVVDLVEDARTGTYTGLYYLFSTLAAIAGPNVNGGIIQILGENYNSIMVVGAVFMIVALALMWGVRRGEAVIDKQTLR